MRCLYAAIALAACGGGSDTKVHKGSAAPVELVSEPIRSDAGGSAGDSGSPTNEVEPNDAVDVATPLALGPLVAGTLDPADTDADFYRIDAPQPGALAISVAPAESDVVVDVIDSTGAVVAHSDRGGKQREGVPNLGIGAGATYVVVRAKPRAKPKKGTLPPLPPINYKLTAQLAPFAAGAEREPDDDRGTANELLLADKVTGFIGWDKDADVWKLSVDTLASGKNVIDVEVTKVEGLALELEIADGTGAPIATRKAPRGTPASIYGLVPVVPQGGSPFHYLTVRADRSNPLAPYELTVKVHPLDADAEVEPDDAPEHPFVVAPERSVVHASWTPGDVDCFELATGPLVHTVDVAIDTPKDLDLSIDLYADGKVVAKSEHAGRGAAEHVTAKIPKNARTIVRVRGADASITASGGYDLLIKDTGLPTLEP